MKINMPAVAVSDSGVRMRTFFGCLVLSLCLLLISHRHTAYMVLDIVLLFGIYALAVNFRHVLTRLRHDYLTIVSIPLIYVAGHMVSVVWYDDYGEFPVKSLYLYALLPLMVPAFDRYAIKAHWLWYGVSLAGITAGVFAVVEVAIQDVPRAGGSFHKPIIFGDLSLMLGLLSLMASRFFYQRHRYLLIMAGLGLAGGVLASLLSQSRGGWVYIPVALIILGWCYQDVWRQSVTLRRGVIVGLVFLVCVFIAYSPVLTKRIGLAESQLQMYVGDGPRGNSIGIRLELWRGAVEMISEHPFVGVGLHEFKDNIGDQADDGKVIKATRNYRHAHNQYLQAWSAAGIFGLVGLLLAFWLPLRFFGREWRNACLEIRALAVSGVLLVSGFSVFCLTDSLFVVSHAVKFYFFFILLLGYLLIRHKSEAAVVALSENAGRRI